MAMLLSIRERSQGLISCQPKIFLQNYTFGGVPAAEDSGSSNSIFSKDFRRTT
jgi:hypothetical protein